jgi:PhnB protein
MPFDPYLFFDGDCREAFTRYQEIFGGELQLVRMADMPSEEPLPADQAELLAHASLRSDGDLLMGSDDPSGGFTTPDGMRVCYTATTADDAKRVFEALAEGGDVQLPVGETPWSPMFGMCRDRFGTPWMVDTDTSR